MFGRRTLVTVSADSIIALLRKQTIASLPEVMAALGTRARRTAFRKLKDLAACTCYSHRGGYYTLDELVDFDEHGLWAFGSVRFSRAGTLIATAESFVNQAQAGHFGEELDNLLPVGRPGRVAQARRRRAPDAAQARRPVPVLRGRPAAARSPSPDRRRRERQRGGPGSVEAARRHKGRRQAVRTCSSPERPVGRYPKDRERAERATSEDQRPQRSLARDGRRRRRRERAQDQAP